MSLHANRLEHYHNNVTVSSPQSDMINTVEPLHFPLHKINCAQNGADLLATQPSLLIWTSLLTVQERILQEGKMKLYCNLTPPSKKDVSTIQQTPFIV